MSANSVPTLASGRYFSRPPATECDAKPRIENGRFYSGFSNTAPDAKPRAIADLPLPLVKLIHRFATRCSLDCCGWDALELAEPSADDDDERWTIRLALEDEFARARGDIERSDAELLWFPQLSLGAAKADALFVFGWFEDGLRRAKAS